MAPRTHNTPESQNLLLDTRGDRAGAMGGRRYTDIVALDYDRVLLVFRPAPDQRWRAWELLRLFWILDEDLKDRAA
jgi:hypothetical protein